MSIPARLAFGISLRCYKFEKYKYPFNRSFYMIINVAVGGKYDDYRVDESAFCNNAACSNKDSPDMHRFLIDWIEYREL